MEDEIDPEQLTARLVDLDGQEMSHESFAGMLEFLQNQLYDQDESIYGEKQIGPMDEFTKRRMQIKITNFGK